MLDLTISRTAESYLPFALDPEKNQLFFIIFKKLSFGENFGKEKVVLEWSQEYGGCFKSYTTHMYIHTYKTEMIIKFQQDRNGKSKRLALPGIAIRSVVALISGYT